MQISFYFSCYGEQRFASQSQVRQNCDSKILYSVWSEKETKAICYVNFYRHNITSHQSVYMHKMLIQHYMYIIGTYISQRQIFRCRVRGTRKARKKESQCNLNQREYNIFSSYFSLKTHTQRHINIYNIILYAFQLHNKAIFQVVPKHTQMRT